MGVGWRGEGWPPCITRSRSVNGPKARDGEMMYIERYRQLVTAPYCFQHILCAMGSLGGGGSIYGALRSPAAYL